MVVTLFEDLEERFPGIARPDWYSDAVSYLRGDADEGLFGLYLHELIRSRPDVETVLNIGTARGHSVVCAAKAMDSAGRTGTIHTIDITPPDECRNWHVTKHPQSDPLRNKRWSSREIIERFHDTDSSRIPIQFHTGDSLQVLARWDAEQPDLVFHDGLHQYDTVVTDIARTVDLGAGTPIQVFDDCYLYSPVWSYRPFLTSHLHRLDRIPKIGGGSSAGSASSLSKIRFAGVTQAVRESYEEGPWRSLKVVSDSDHAPITGLFPGTDAPVYPISES